MVVRTEDRRGRPLSGVKLSILPEAMTAMGIAGSCSDFCTTRFNTRRIVLDNCENDRKEPLACQLWITTRLLWRRYGIVMRTRVPGLSKQRHGICRNSESETCETRRDGRNMEQGLRES